MNELARKVIEITRRAGEVVLAHYDDPGDGLDYKSPDHPLTKADTASHHLIAQALAELTPDIPVISEEGDLSAGISAAVRRFWLVDPLDGTKEFLKKTGEFTVNIALVDGNYPVFGVIGAPVQDRIWIGTAGEGAAMIEGNNSPEQLRPKAGKATVATCSVTHTDPQEAEIFKALGIAKVNPAGSSLKFCYVASGLAQLYVRVGPTSEWDTAAGQAIVEAVAGVVIAQGERFIYRKPRFRNSSFICAADSQTVREIQQLGFSL